ncbi:MAG: hypothetical protein AYK19_22480 [Theionarchaea archaeon DG-70-1]|nr:MAG: hypothetical protein AYK19_22480 [Theionarchaea archaeon DG-70-1]
MWVSRARTGAFTKGFYVFKWPSFQFLHCLHLSFFLGIFKIKLYWFTCKPTLLHFIIRCLFCRAFYIKNLELRENDNQVLFESEKEFFSDKKYRGDVFDPFTCVLYEIQRDSKEIRKKKRIFNRSSEIEFVKFINPLGFSKAEEFEGLLTEIWDEIQGVIEVI